METETKKEQNKLQYMHNLRYVGNITNNKDNRMSLLIEEINPTEILVTKAVCSSKDQFTKVTARKRLHERMLAHKSCIKNSKNYISITKNVKIHTYVYKDDEYWTIEATVTTYRHTRSYSDMAYHINIKNIAPYNPAKFHEENRPGYIQFLYSLFTLLGDPNFFYV